MEGRDLEISVGIEELAKREDMEAPNRALPSWWNFIRDLPGFTVLFLLGITKGELQLLPSFCYFLFLFSCYETHPFAFELYVI